MPVKYIDDISYLYESKIGNQDQLVQNTSDLKNTGPEGLISEPGRNFKAFGFGVSSVWINITSYLEKFFKMVPAAGLEPARAKLRRF